MTFVDRFRLALARMLFKAGLSSFAGRALPEGAIVLIDGGTKLVLRRNGSIETRTRNRVGH